MAKIFCGVCASVGTGILGHVVFYPIIEAWHNHRMRKLARPSIGVIINLFPFLLWLKIFCRKERLDDVTPVAAYLVSFLWVGVGVVAGYLINDWKEAS
jgi:hypothetical protein